MIVVAVAIEESLKLRLEGSMKHDGLACSEFIWFHIRNIKVSTEARGKS